MLKQIPGRLSIVMPAFNEEEIITRSVEELADKVLARFDDGELIVVDDCSRDRTWEILLDLQQRIPALVPLRNPQNRGHGPSLLRGLRAARCQYIFTLDSDYQLPPDEFWKLFPAITEHDIVTGLRHNRQDPPYRKVLSRTVNLTARWLFACNLQDLNIPFKLFHQEALKTILDELPENCLTPSIFIMLAASGMGFSVCQVPVHHLPRTTGRCSLPGLRLISFSCAAFGELLQFRLRQWPKITQSTPRGNG